MEFDYNKDFWAGLMFVGTGAAAMFIARGYRFGSALNMGPGFFPTMLGGILIVFGILILLVGLHGKEKARARLSLRALILLPLSLVLFGVLMGLLGFIPAMVALIFGAAASDKEFKFVKVLVIAVVLIVASVALFIWGLGLSYPLIKGF